MATINEKKFNLLEETVKEAVKKGILEDRMDLIKLQAADLNLNDDELKSIIDRIKESNKDEERIISILSSFKGEIYFSVISMIIIEWFLSFIVGIDKFSTIIWILFINIFTAALITFIIAHVVRKKK